MRALHDWALEELSLDWKSGELILKVSGYERINRIMCQGLRHLDMPRENPWGPSVFINECRGPMSVDGEAKLEIEMQSGDVIVISAAKILLPQE